MTDITKSKYVKRTQKDYSMSFKLRVVEEVERGDLGIKATTRKYGIQSHSTVSNWLRKYSNFDWYNQKPHTMSKSAEQKILELEQKVIFLEKQKNYWEFQAGRSEKKVILFDMMIETAEKELKIPIRKKSLPE